jgi:16S rRNA (guanine966-N2)-methyltransferase
MDRVKAAIFSSITPLLPGARVLDLFAGTGALGIEALSRGAASAVFVENNRAAVEAIRANLTSTLLQGDVYPRDIFSYLAKGAQPGEFDIIFADPPYAKAPGERDFGAELIACDELRRALKPDGLFILEQLPGTGPREKSAWECARLKKYGATEVAFFRVRQPEA